ncbi:MAG: T9SS type A sorting domain-containing protein [Bacteroidia bacterium]
MKRQFYAVLAILAIFFNITASYAQTVTLTVKANLPSVLDESSGIEATNKNSIWSHNDSSGETKLYNFDSTGALLRTLTILNASNIDWEDVAIDTAGNFYIGDIGNNDNNRQDLKIYIIPAPQSILGDTVSAQTINYTYANQISFPPADSLKNFDAEAMIVYNDSIFIFSKDRTDPYSGYTNLYSMPKTPGTYVAELVDSFYTGSGPQQFYSITAADISANQNRLVLLAYNRCWIFSDFVGSNFFGGEVKMLEFTNFSQKEGICFASENELYITDELNSGIGQKLYYLNIEQYFSSVGTDEMITNELSIFPNPFSEYFAIKMQMEQNNSYEFTVYNQLGQKICTKSIMYANIEQLVSFENGLLTLEKGVYFLEIKNQQKTLFLKKLIKVKQ